MVGQAGRPAGQVAKFAEGGLSGSGGDVDVDICQSVGRGRAGGQFGWRCLAYWSVGRVVSLGTDFVWVGRSTGWGGLTVRAGMSGVSVGRSVGQVGRAYSSGGDVRRAGPSVGSGLQAAMSGMLAGWTGRAR
jgi:hypothetical protein